MFDFSRLTDAEVRNRYFSGKWNHWQHWGIVKNITFSSKKHKSCVFCVFYWKRCCPSSLKSDSRTFRKHDLQFPGASKHKNNWKNRTFRDGSAPKNHQKPFFLKKCCLVICELKHFEKHRFLQYFFKNNEIHS